MMRKHFYANWHNISSGRIWTLFTSMFTHNDSDVTHILFNGFTFYFMAPLVLQILGSRRFLFLYLGGGALSELFSIAYDQITTGRDRYSVGASGAIYSILSFLAFTEPRMTLLIYGIVPVPIWLTVTGLFSYETYLTAWDKAGTSNSSGHVGGILSGAGPWDNRLYLPPTAITSELNPSTNMDRPSVPQLPSLSSSLVQAAIQATAQFTPVPALAPVAQLVSNIITLCQNVSQNKATAAQLSTRCHRMLLVINERHTMNENVDAALKSFTKCLGDVQVIMEKCVQLSKLKAFLHQYDISVEIARCHSILSDCFNAFQAWVVLRFGIGSLLQEQIASHTELHEWQAQFKESSKQDHRELVGYLGDITNSQTIIYDLLEKIHENTLAERQSQSSDFLRETKVKDQSHIGLSSNLYDLQLQSRELLPDFNLRSGEVIRSGIFPVSGTSSMDIYEGLYLQREKVAIKVVRAVNAGPDSARRFERECEIWKELWKRDGGKYILPFYGFSQSDGPFPYIVSPWQANGSAIQYVKRHDLSAKGIALGIQILHNMTPPIVHGDIKAMNIAINNLGNPLIADFGLSCIVEDITGIPFSQSRGVSESYRWFAPELCVGQGVLSASSDIYAFGMTVLELFTHEHPYKEVKHTAEVVIKSSQGIQPKRPTSERVLERGLSDALCYYKATGWNEDNLYANITRSSNAILDFSVPRGLHLAVSKSPNSLFKTTYSMTAMPSLSGSVGYIFTSCDLDVKNSGNVRFKDMIERFRVYDQPRRAEPKEEEFLNGELVNNRDYLMYGRFYLPTGRLDALYSTRLSPTVQALVAAISHPPSNINSPAPRNSNVSNLIVNIQHDVGKWCTEYTWSADDSMWGVRVLHNFGKLGMAQENSDDPEKAAARTGVKRVDEEDAIEGGLKGRVSAGAEFYFSAREKSGGVSTGFRFSTLPESSPPSFQAPGPSSSPLTTITRGPPTQAPTTITALFNPMLGHISSAYSSRVSRDLSLASRFDFNVYSYESEWTMGAEWWMRSRADADSEDESPLTSRESGQVRGVLKARASTNRDVALLWEGRVQQTLVSVGVVSDLSNSAKPIKAIGLELSYFSSDEK
ncbi:unnamed protein product [Mycena citricolor]|uniref:Mitochondrial distribution and morphology protein 10 n=1 Tax=Mycena citricolor TaxID=2018698 RepID=A0AAD2HH08_9AGAR|nr:unnamed protein product [Mycena citricolor]